MGSNQWIVPELDAGNDAMPSASAIASKAAEDSCSAAKVSAQTPDQPRPTVRDPGAGMPVDLGNHDLATSTE
jgi:hypothetical protein